VVSIKTPKARKKKPTGVTYSSLALCGSLHQHNACHEPSITRALRSRQAEHLDTSKHQSSPIALRLQTRQQQFREEKRQNTTSKAAQNLSHHLIMRPSLRLLHAAPLNTAKGLSSPGPMALLPPIYLYRRLLRAHRVHLPAEMRVLGDEYVKAEFRAHREVENPVHLVSFYTAYIHTQ
jgi:hypothetical protein